MRGLPECGVDVFDEFVVRRREERGEDACRQFEPDMTGIAAEVQDIDQELVTCFSSIQDRLLPCSIAPCSSYSSGSRLTFFFSAPV